MPTRSSSAQWSGNLPDGKGTMSLGSGASREAERIGDDEFRKHAEEAQKTCPVSRALGAIDIGLDGKLV